MLGSMNDITLELNQLTFVQTVLAWAFVGCYALSLGGMLGSSGSTRSAALAGLAAIAFCVVSDHWVHGALLVLFSVAGIGVFVAAAWLITRAAVWWSQPERQRPATSAPVTPVTAPAQPITGVLRDLWRSLA